MLLALLVIAVWEQYQRANETVESEANAVAEIAWLAHGLQIPIASSCRNTPGPTLKR